jgi:hypothetical protein
MSKFSYGNLPFTLQPLGITYFAFGQNSLGAISKRLEDSDKASMNLPQPSDFKFFS